VRLATALWLHPPKYQPRIAGLFYDYNMTKPDPQTEHTAEPLHPVMQRRFLRKHLRQQRKALSTDSQEQHALALNQHLSRNKLFKRSKRIGAYLAADGEIDPSYLIEGAWLANKKIYLPILAPFSLRIYFAPYTVNSKMKLNRFHIAEPDVHPKHWLKPQQLDLILMPLVGFDKSGNRLGMGGGFYDRSLNFMHFRNRAFKPYLIGLAHELQKVDRLPVQTHDVPLKIIATELQLHICQ